MPRLAGQVRVQAAPSRKCRFLLSALTLKGELPEG